MATDAGLTADAHIKARPKRRWFQFSLRTLMVLMLAFACGFGWLSLLDQAGPAAATDCGDTCDEGRRDCSQG